MALSDYLLQYSKDWRNPSDFPTYETKETKVREDMQLLFDEMKAAFNAFLVDLAANMIPFTSSAAVPEDNVQDAILNVQEQIASAVTGDINIPPRSLDGVKLKLGAITADELSAGCVGNSALATVDASGENGAVSANNINKNAVTRAKIADEAVDGNKIAPGSVKTNHIEGGAVTGAKIKDGDVSAAKLASADANGENGAVTTAKINHGAVTAIKLATDSVETAKIKDANVTNAKLASADANGANGAVSTDKINHGAVTPEKIAPNAVSTMYNGTITTADWIGSAAPFTQSVTVTGVLATDEPMVDLIPSDVYATAALEDSQWGQIYKAVTGTDTITFYAKEKPTVALTFKARCIRK